MLQPVISPTPPTAPTVALVAPRPVAQEQPNAAARNITARAVSANDETDDTREDTQDGHNARVDGERQTTPFRRKTGARGENLDIFV